MLYRSARQGKNATEHLDGKKEGVASFDPVRVISGESAGRNHAMDVRVKPQLLIPGVQRAEESRFLHRDVWDRERLPEGFPH